MQALSFDFGVVRLVEDVKEQVSPLRQRLADAVRRLLNGRSVAPLDNHDNVVFRAKGFYIIKPAFIELALGVD